MNFQTVKTNDEIALEGCKFNIERTDNEIVRVTLTDAKGGVLRFEKGDWNSMRVLVKAQPKMETRFLLVGSVKGIRVREVFREEREAKRRLEELSDLSGDLKVGPIEVEQGTDPEVIRNATDEIPF